MPFLKAGFNARNRDTRIRGWTRHVNGGQFAAAELRRFRCGDLFWLGERIVKGELLNFLVWGEQVVLGSHWGFDLPWEFQNGLAHSVIETREERPAWKWAEEMRAKLGRKQTMREAKARHHQEALF